MFEQPSQRANSAEEQKQEDTGVADAEMHNVDGGDKATQPKRNRVKPPAL